MKKYIISSIVFLTFPLLQAGWHTRLLEDPKQEVQNALIEIAQTGAREQAPDMAEHAERNREFYVHMASSGLLSANKWYLFDGSQEAAQVIQQSATGRLTWYYCNHATGPEK